jgi:hypothetical protein
MELGFHHQFFIKTLMRNGWLVERRPSDVYRAITYIATPMSGAIPVGKSIEFPAGWSAGEGEHRWTIAEDAVLPLPYRRFGRMAVTVGLVNYLAQTKVVIMSAGHTKRSVTIQSGKSCCVSLVCEPDSENLHIRAPLSSTAGESRMLGIAVTSVTIERH